MPLPRQRCWCFSWEIAGEILWVLVTQVEDAPGGWLMVIAFMICPVLPVILVGGHSLQVENDLIPRMAELPSVVLSMNCILYVSENCWAHIKGRICLSILFLEIRFSWYIVSTGSHWPMGVVRPPLWILRYPERIDTLGYWQVMVTERYDLGHPGSISKVYSCNHPT